MFPLVLVRVQVLQPSLSRHFTTIKYKEKIPLCTRTRQYKCYNLYSITTDFTTIKYMKKFFPCTSATICTLSRHFTTIKYKKNSLYLYKYKCCNLYSITTIYHDKIQEIQKKLQRLIVTCTYKLLPSRQFTTIKSKGKKLNPHHDNLPR